uniref:Ubiquitin-like domain-containing protein n=1 Tax=Graphocephala atropunctata TaxID=36148 RepID=A0A1B6KIU4_9HEMI
MSVIEGIGDEVLQFFSVVSVVVLMIVAWRSTNTRENTHNLATLSERWSRSRRRGETSRPASSIAISDIDQQVSSGDVGTEASTGNAQEERENEIPMSCTNEHTVVIPRTKSAKFSLQKGSATTEQNPRETTEFSTTESKTQLASQPLETTSVGVSEQTMRDGDEIMIRLKYLNGEEKLVEARLNEQLGEFKRRVFITELLAEKRIRLIFGGKMLDSNELSLQAYGLYDGSVVHCLVHTWRAPSAPNIPASPQQSPEWNLGTLLKFSLSLIFCFLWYCRYQYSHLFTHTATFALVNLSALLVEYMVYTVRHPVQDNVY